jgi:hypothetical protein
MSGPCFCLDTSHVLVITRHSSTRGVHFLRPGPAEARRPGTCSPGLPVASEHRGRGHGCCVLRAVCCVMCSSNATRQLQQATGSKGRARGRQKKKAPLPLWVGALKRARGWQKADEVKGSPDLFWPPHLVPRLTHKTSRQLSHYTPLVAFSQSRRGRTSGIQHSTILGYRSARSAKRF